MTVVQDPRPAPAVAEPPPGQELDETRAMKLFVCGVALVVTALAISRMGRPFWVDEITTAWTAEEDWPTTWSRIDTFVTNSPVHSVFMWLWAQPFGIGPVALRTPSILAVAATVIVVYRTASYVDRPAVAWASVGIFVTFTEVSVTAGNARVYAFAMLFVALMHRSALRWIDNGDRRSAVLVALWATLAVHAHVLMVFSILALVVAVWTRRQRSSTWRRDVAPMMVAGAAGAATVAPVLLRAASRTSNYEALAQPSPSLLLHLWISPAQLVVVGLVLLVSWRLRPLTSRERHCVGYLLAACSPLIIGWALSRGLGMGVFLPRYLVGIFPPLAILVAGTLLRIRRPGARVAAVLAMVGLGLVPLFGTVGNASNWKRAVDWTNAVTADRDAAVLLEPLHLMGKDRSFFVDDDGEWIFEDAESLTWVNPVETAHPIDAPMYGLPYASSTWGGEYLDALLDARLEGVDMVVLIGNFTRPERDYTELVRLRMADRGYTEQPVPELDREVLLFTRD